MGFRIAMVRFLTWIDLKVQALVACMGIHTPEAHPALAWLEYTSGDMPTGKHHDIRQALEMLANGRPASRWRTAGATYARPVLKGIG